MMRHTYAGLSAVVLAVAASAAAGAGPGPAASLPTDADLMTAAVRSPPPPVPDPLVAADYADRYAKALRLVAPDPETGSGVPTTGARVVAVDPGSAAAAAGLEVGDVIVAIDGTPTPDRDALTRARAAGGAQTLEVVTATRPGRRSLAVPAGHLGIKAVDGWMLEGQYLHDLPAGVRPSDEVRVAARCATSDPPLAESALARAKTAAAGRRPADPALTNPVVDAIAAVALFNDSWYDDALAYGTAAAAGLPADCRPRLTTVLIGSALATGRFPLARSLAKGEPWFDARVIAAVGAQADAVTAHPRPAVDPAAAPLETFVDRTRQLDNLAPHVNGEFRCSADMIRGITRQGSEGFESASGQYNVLECGPGDANVEFSARCHFRATDQDPTRFVKVFRVGFASDGDTVKELELYLDGRSDVQGADARTPDGRLDLHRLVADDQAFDLRMTVVGGWYRFLIDGRPVFSGPVPPTLAEGDRKLTLSLQTVGLTGDIDGVHWRTAGPR